MSGTLAAPAGAVLRAKETDQLWTFLRDPEIYKGGIGAISATLLRDGHGSGAAAKQRFFSA